MRKNKGVERGIAVSLEQYRLEPNVMQVAFVKNIRELLRKSEKKALLISATGACVIIETERRAVYNKDFSDLSFLLAGRRVWVNEAM